MNPTPTKEQLDAARKRLREMEAETGWSKKTIAEREKYNDEWSRHAATVVDADRHSCEAASRSDKPLTENEVQNVIGDDFFCIDKSDRVAVYVNRRTFLCVLENREQFENLKSLLATRD